MLEPKRHPGGRSGAERPVATRPPSDAVCLRVVLLGMVPPVWRRLRLPAHFTLRQLHAVLQCTMGELRCEAHRFRVGDALYGNTSDRAQPRDSRWITLADVVGLGARSFRYELSGEEDWKHEILIEEISDGTSDNQRPVCLDGERPWPPESGGRTASGERIEFLGADALESPGFDLEEINRALSRLR